MRKVWPWAVAAAVFIADRVTKILAPGIPENGVVLIPGVIGLNWVQNTGMALGLLQDHPLLILLVSLALAGFAVWELRAFKPQGLARVSLSLIAGGALSNMIDRAVYGSVLDMLELLFMRFYIFNVADIGVVAGAILCGLSLLLICLCNSSGSSCFFSCL
jgi:signal peptidase II